MKNNQSASGKFDFQLDQGGIVSRHKTGFLPDGAYLFEDELAINGFLTAKVITCAAWLLELCQLAAGDFFFIKDVVEVRPRTRSFGVLYPPFSISQPCFRKVKGNVVGVAATSSLPREFATRPMVFDTTFVGVPTNAGN